MRLAKISRTLLLLALPLVLVTCALAQEHPNVLPSKVRDQLSHAPAASTSQPAVSQAKPALPTKPPAQRPTKVPVTTTTAAKTAMTKAAKPPVQNPAQEKISVTRRDPFDALLNKSRGGPATPENLPPGKAGLVVSSLRIDGIVRGSGGMIAIVSNPQQRVYFLREGDKLYDGTVQHITLEAISFQEFGKDAFGKPLERQVTKRLYPSPGESQ